MERYFWERIERDGKHCVIYDRRQGSDDEKEIAVTPSDYEATIICDALNSESRAE